MKKVGVPVTPLMSAESTSSSIRAALRVVAEVVVEALEVEPELLRVRPQVEGLEVVLVFEQQVVHLPERALGGGGLRCLGGELGVRVDVGERKVPPDVSDVGEVRQQLAHDRLRLAAVGALEVAVLDQRHRGRDRTADVIAVGIDRDGEVDERLRAADQGPDARPAAAASRWP